MFLWLIDRTTSEEITNGERYGVVLYGRTIPARQIAADLGIYEKTCRDHLQRLESGGYVQMVKKSAGHVIRVRNSLKWLWRGEREQHRSKPAECFRSGKAVPGTGNIDWEAEAKRHL